MWPFTSCGYNPRHELSETNGISADEIWGMPARAADANAGSPSSPGFSEECFVGPLADQSPGADNTLDRPAPVDQVGSRDPDDLSRYLFSAGTSDNEIRLVPNWSKLVADHKAYRSLHDEVYAQEDDEDPSPADVTRISRAQGETSATKARRRESVIMPPAVAKGTRFQDYATATSSAASTADGLQAENRLHAWLIARDLARYYVSLRALGAKRISDLAFLTDDDMDDLGLSIDERKKLTVCMA